MKSVLLENAALNVYRTKIITSRQSKGGVWFLKKSSSQKKRSSRSLTQSGKATAKICTILEGFTRSYPGSGNLSFALAKNLSARRTIVYVSSREEDVENFAHVKTVSTKRALRNSWKSPWNNCGSNTWKTITRNKFNSWYRTI